MPTADNYKNPSCRSAKGNVAADIITYTMTGAEAADTVVKMRRMDEYNTYLRVSVLSDAGMVGTLDVGTVSNQDGQADEPQKFDAATDIATAVNSLVTIPVAVAYKHDLALVIKTNNAGNAGKKVRLFVEFVADAG